MKYGIFLTLCYFVSSTCFGAIDTVSVIGSASSVFNNSYKKNASQLAATLVNQKKMVLCANDGTGLSGAFLKTLSDRKGNFIAINYKENNTLSCPKQHPCNSDEVKQVSHFNDQIEYLISEADGIVFLPGSFDVLYAFNYLQALSKQKEMIYKPVVFLNTNHYWDRLREMLIEMKRQNIISQNVLDTIAFENRPENTIKTLEKLQKTIETLNQKDQL